MPGFSAQATASQARSGNTVAVAIGDTTVAFAQTVGLALPMGAEQLYGIGSSKPQEVQQLRMSPSITLDSFALTENGLKLLANGQNLNYLLAGNQFDIYLLDGLNAQQTLFAYVGCKCSNFSQNVPANAIVRDSYSFLAMDVLDPNGNSIMDTGENALAVASAAVSTVANTLGISP